MTKVSDWLRNQRSSVQLFQDLKLFIPCVCYNGDPYENGVCGCMCGRDERIMRFFAAGMAKRLMSPVERAWCIEEANRAGEGDYDRVGLASLDDQELAQTVLQAWQSYVDSLIFSYDFKITRTLSP